VFEFVEHQHRRDCYIVAYPLASEFMWDDTHKKTLWSIQEQEQLYKRLQGCDMIILGLRSDGAWHHIVWDSINQRHIDPVGRYSDEPTIQPKAVWTVTHAEDSFG
jgi:hypothetical protein